MRAAIAGCGLFGESHAAALQGLGDVQIAAVFDVNAAKAQQFAGRFSVPVVVQSLEDLIREGVDTIHVVTPESQHREPVVAALAAGKHVLVEKPFATTIKDCEAMMDAARTSRGMLMVGHILRFDLRYGALRERALAGAFGRMVNVSARRNRARAGFELYQRIHPAICNSVHDIDVILSVAQSRVVRVRAFERRVRGYENPDFFLGFMEFENGTLAEVQTSWLLPDAAGVPLDDHMQIIGEKGTAVLTLQPPAVSLWTEGGYSAPDTGYETRLGGAAYGALLNEIAYFYKCVRTGNPPAVITPAEATNAVRVALAMIESAVCGRDIDIANWS
jgi:predicted dehydrogenase